MEHLKLTLPVKIGIMGTIFLLLINILHFGKPSPIKALHQQVRMDINNQIAKDTGSTLPVGAHIHDIELVKIDSMGNDQLNISVNIHIKINSIVQIYQSTLLYDNRNGKKELVSLEEWRPEQPPVKNRLFINQ